VTAEKVDGLRSRLAPDYPGPDRLWDLVERHRLAVDERRSLDDATPLLHRVSPTSQLLRVAPPLCLASVLSSSGFFPLDFSLGIEATGSHVPHKGPVQGHATFMPGAAHAGYRLLVD
jgi:hypothetical protein